MQPRYYAFMENTRTTAEAIAIGAAVDIDANGQLENAAVNAGVALACQAAEVLSSETRDVYSASYTGTRNPYTVRTQNVGDPLAIVRSPAILDGYDAYLGTVAIGDKLYCSGTSGKLCNAAYLTNVGGNSATATELARAMSGGTAGTDTISISVLVA